MTSLDPTPDNRPSARTDLPGESARLGDPALEALLRASRSLMSGLDLPTILDRIVVEAGFMAGVPHVTLLLVERSARVLRLAAQTGEIVPAGFQVPLGADLSGRVAESGEPLFSADSPSDPRNLLAERDRRLGLKTYLGLPVRSRDEVLGVLTFETTTPKRYTPEELAYLTAFADQAALAIESSGLFQKEQTRRRELEALRAVTEEIARELDLPTLLRLMHERAIALVQGDSGTVYLWDEAAQLLIPKSRHGFANRKEGIRLRPGEAVAGSVAARREGMIVNDYRTSPYAHPALLAQSPHVAVVAEPLLYRDRLVGVLSINRNDPTRPFTEEDQRLVRLFATHAAIAIENAQLYEAAQRELAERARAEEALQRFHLLADEARDIVLFVGRDGRILDANRAAVAAYGYAREDLLSLTIPDLRAPETHPLTVAQLAQAEAQGILFETVHRRRDGTTFPVEVSSRGTRLGQEVVLLSIIRDITARKQAEAALARRNRHLEAIRAVSEEITHELDLTRLLRLLIARAADLVGASAATIYLWKPERGVLVPAAWHGLGDWQAAIHLPLGQGIAGAVAQMRQGLSVNDYRTSRFANPVTLEHTQLTASLGEPLMYREELIGAITLGHEGGRCFSGEDQELLRLFATHAAIAIENARLYDTAVRRGEELQALLDASRSLMDDLDLRGILERITSAASTISGSTRIKIALYDPAAGALRVECDTGSGTPVGTLIPLEGTLSGLAIRTQQPIFSADSAHDPRNAFAAEDAARGLVTSLNLPIRYRETVLGSLSFNTTVPRSYTAEELRYLQAFATQAAIAIEYARLYQAAVRRGAELEALLRTSHSLMSGLDLQKILDRIATEAATIAGTPSVKVLLVDKEVGQIRLGALTGATACEFPIPVGTGLSGLVASSGEPIFSSDCQNDPRNVSAAADRDSGVVTYLGLPIRSRGEVVGILTFSTTAPREYPSEELAYLISFADQAAIAIENARLFEDQRQAYRELQQAKDELVRSEKLRALGQMAAGIAHDLNNMLAAILGQAELLRLRIQLPEVQEALQTLYTAATDGAQVVRRLQEFGRRQASTPLVPCDLASIVHEVLELTRPRWRDEAQRQGRAIQVQTSLDKLPQVLGHPSEIREALTNLILNAMDAMPEGGTLTLAGSADPAPPLSGKPGGVSLRVTDTGIGMPEAVCRRIFEPFFTTKGPGGTGLGLAVVYGILERHGGRIDVSSTPGRGTTFTLRFQAAPRESGKADRSSIPQVPIPRRLLIIDDETTVRTTIANLLRAVGHTVTEAQSGPEGLASLAEHSVDLVITDLGMPGMTGWEVAQQLKAAHPHLPAILLTGWGQQAAPPASGQNCVDRVLAKPIRLEDLQGAIAALTATGNSPHLDA